MRTAATAVLGLSLLAGCKDDVTEPVSVYGIAPTPRSKTASSAMTTAPSASAAPSSSASPASGK